MRARPGAWSGVDFISYQWERCNASGAECAAIPASEGGHGSSYVLASLDVGHAMRVGVTASNTAGTTGPLASAASAIVVVQAPVVIEAPAITGGLDAGQAVPGQAITASSGRWVGTQPIPYSYQWQDCDAQGTACADVLTGGTSSAYTVPSANPTSTQTVRAVVTASNSVGST